MYVYVSGSTQEIGQHEGLTHIGIREAPSRIIILTLFPTSVILDSTLLPFGFVITSGHCVLS